MALLLPQEILMAEVERLLREGKEVTLRARGNSMRPYITNNEDNLILKQIAPDEIAVNQIVLAKMDQKHYVAHRVIELDGDSVVMMGDGNMLAVERVKRNQIIGYVSAIQRKSGEVVDCNTPREIALALKACHARRRKIKFKRLVKNILVKLRLYPDK